MLSISALLLSGHTTCGLANGAWWFFCITLLYVYENSFVGSIPSLNEEMYQQVNLPCGKNESILKFMRPAMSLDANFSCNLM